MGPMMGWMMGLGWLAALVLVVLVVAGVVWLVRSFARGPGHADGAAGTASKIVLGVLAVVGPSHSSLSRRRR